MEDPATPVPSSLWTSLNSYFTSTVLFILLNLMIATIVFTSNLSSNDNHQEPQQEDHHQQEEKQDSHDQQNQPQIVRSPSILNRLKSFNFNALKPQPGSDPDTYYQENPIEVAARQYVFNEPLHYQHFDLDPVNPGKETETGVTIFDFDPTHQETDTTHFNYHPINTGQETETVMTHFELESIHQEKVTHLDFEPTHEEIDSDTGVEDADEFESLDEVYTKLKGGGGGRTKSAGEVPAKIPVNPPAGKMKKSASLKVGFSNFDSEKIVEARRPATARERKKAVPTAVDNDDVEVDAKADDFINKFKNDLKLQRIESIIRTKGGKK